MLGTRSEPATADAARAGSGRGKDVLAGRFADGDDGRVLDLALYRNGVEMLANGLRTAGDAHAIAAKDLAFDHRWRREHAKAVFAELLRQRAVIHLADEARPDVLGVEPVLERAPHRRGRAGEQKRDLVERAGKPGSDLG